MAWVRTGEPGRAGYRTRVRWRCLGLVTLCALVATGCAPVGADDARRTAADFQDRVDAADWPGACDLMSEHARRGLEGAAARPCAAALAALRLPTDPIGRAQVWGRNAGVQVGSGAVFLSRFNSGWLVIAAGCSPQGKDRPYDCTIGG